MVPPTRSQVVAAVILVLALLALIATRMHTGSALGSGTKPTHGQSSPHTAAATPDSAQPSGRTARSGRELIVDITGAVNRPGVYSMVDGARVLDIIARAGGSVTGADLSAINRAAPLVDGQQVVIPLKGRTSSGATAASPAPGAKVSLNSGTVDQLDELPGFGPATAQKIVDDRTKNGPFTSIDDLDRVPGIGAAKIEAIRDLVTI